MSEMRRESCPSAGCALLLGHLPQMRHKYGEGITKMQTQPLQTNETCQLRALGYIFGTLSYLQSEPLCRTCTSLVKVFETAMGKFLVTEKALGKEKSLPEETRQMLLYIYTVLSEIKMPDSPVRQKKEGQCGFPPGVCLAKNTLAIYERIDGET